MIAFLAGKIVYAQENWAIVRSPSGPGYQIYLPPNWRVIVNENVEWPVLEMQDKNKPPRLQAFGSFADRALAQELWQNVQLDCNLILHLIYSLGGHDLGKLCREGSSSLLAKTCAIDTKIAKKIIDYFQPTIVELKTKKTTAKKEETDFRLREKTLDKNVERILEKTGEKSSKISPKDLAIRFTEKMTGLGWSRGKIVEIISKFKREGTWEDQSLTQLLEQAKKLQR